MNEYVWKIQVQIAQCQGIEHQKEAEYSLLIRLGDQFSSSSPPGRPSSKSSKITFNHTLVISLNSSKAQLPHSELQLILVMGQKTTANGHTDVIEQIIGIATVTIFYPLQEYLEGFKMFRFDKSLDSKGTIKARIKLVRQQVQLSPRTPKSRLSPTKLRLKAVSMPNSSSQPQSQEQIQKKSPPKQKSKSFSSEKYKQLVQSLTQQRNQLYKMSEQLYAQLQRCIDERDDYLRELREKVLSEQMMKAELQFLKLKINQYEQAHHQAMTNKHSYDQIDDLRKYNEDMLVIIEEKDKVVRELERQVKESLVALSQFKKQALNARSQLISKESQLSMLTQQTRSIDPLQCIQQLKRELEDRSFEHPLDLSRFYQRESKAEDLLATIKVELNSFIKTIQNKMKDSRERQWLLKQKLALERRIDEHAGSFFMGQP